MKLFRQSGQENMYLINKGFVWVLVILTVIFMICMGMWLNHNAMNAGAKVRDIELKNALLEGVKDGQQFFIAGLPIMFIPRGGDTLVYRHVERIEQ